MSRILLLPVTSTPTSGSTHLGALAAAAIKCCAGVIEGQLGVGTEIRWDLKGGRCLRFRKADCDVEDVVVRRPCMEKATRYDGLQSNCARYHGKH